MYGGYYIEYFDDDAGHHAGEHFEKLRDARQWAKERGKKLENWKRWDN